jgi:CheY-like chemotaxis protein
VTLRVLALGETVIIASSASLSEAERQKSLTAGCNDSLPKPAQADERERTGKRVRAVRIAVAELTEHAE